MSSQPPAPLRPRDRIGLSSYYFWFFAAIGFTSPYLPLYWRSLGFDYLQVGSLIALGQAAGALTLLPIGALSDRLHTRRPFILGGSVLAGLCYLAYPHAHTFLHFAVLQVLAGAGLAMSASTASALGADVFTRAAAGRSFATVRAWGTIGFVGTMVAVVLWPALPRTPRMFYQVAAIYLFAGLWTLLVVRPGVTERRTLDLRGATRVLGNRNLLAFTAAYFLAYMALMSYSANLSMYLQSFRPPPPGNLMPIAFAISATIELPFLTLAGWSADRFGRVRTLWVAFAVLPLRLAAYAIAPTPEAVLCLQTFHGLTFSILAIVPFAFVTDTVSSEYRATGQALLSAVSSAAAAFGPLLSGLVAHAIGIRWLYLVLGCVAATGTLLFALRVREPERAAA